MTLPNTLSLEPITSPDDVPKLVEIYFTAFQDPLSLRGFPRTPTVRKWFEAMVASELADPRAAHFKVVDRSLASNAAGGDDIVAFAKWNLPKQSDPRVPAPPPDAIQWPDEPAADVELLERFFGLLARKKREIMGVGEGGGGYLYLEMIATLPQHQGRGAGKLLMQWGCEEADKLRRDVYVEASPSGVGLYKRYGFEEIDSVVVDIEGSGPYVNLCMVRKMASESV